MRLVLGRDAWVGGWVARLIPHVGDAEAFGPYTAIGVESEAGW